MPLSTLAVIPARLGATRLPGKPLLLLGGEPLIAQVWRRVAESGIADRCVVATDSHQIKDALTAAGGESVLTRSEHPSGTDRVAEVAAMAAFHEYSVIINVQGDEPFVPDSAIRGAASMVSDGQFQLGTAAAVASPSILESQHVVKVVTADDGRALYFSRAPIPFLRDSSDTVERDDRIRQHIGVYAYTRESLAQWVALPPHPLERIERLEQLRPIAAGISMGVMVIDEPAPEGIDTAEDLERANARWTHHFAGRY
ncbi:MAG: 3-deoxy-manno-octulosonate cytidylyltransferase [Anaerolineae bacterium]|nr:3-deoxy-manno-octulosonate cytidylyltransferase [Gemmatimonadaceae bacterium]